MTNPTLVTVPQGGTMLDVLAERYRAAFNKMEGGREQWIEGTLELAVVVAEARGRMPDHREYNRWITRYQLEQLHPAELAALAGIGNLEHKKPGAGHKLLEKNFGLAVRTIWEKKRERPLADPSEKGRGPNSRVSGASKRKRAAIIPTVMRDDDDKPPPPPRKELSTMMLTPEQVDPDFKGTPLQFATKYGHVLLHTKDQIKHNKRQEALMTWVGTVADHAQTARAMLAALANVDPATLAQWTSKPAKTEKLRAWCNCIQSACEAIIRSAGSAPPHLDDIIPLASAFQQEIPPQLMCRQTLLEPVVVIVNAGNADAPMGEHRLADVSTDTKLAPAGPQRSP